MNVRELEVSVKNLRILDRGFIPVAAFCRNYEKIRRKRKEIAEAERVLAEEYPDCAAMEPHRVAASVSRGGCQPAEAALILQ